MKIKFGCNYCYILIYNNLFRIHKSQNVRPTVCLSVRLLPRLCKRLCKWLKKRVKKGFFVLPSDVRSEIYIASV